MLSQTTTLHNHHQTYSIQPASPQYPLRGPRHTAPGPLQVPHDVPPRDLREHVGDLFHVGGICLAPCGGGGIGGGGGGGGREEEVFHCEGAEGAEEEEGGDGDGLVGIGHVDGSTGRESRWIGGKEVCAIGKERRMEGGTSRVASRVRWNRITAENDCET